MQLEFDNLRGQLAETLNKNRHLKAALLEVNKRTMIKASMIARGGNIIVDVDGILDGEFSRDVPILDYMYIQNCEGLMEEACRNLTMSNNLDARLLVKAYRWLSDNREGYFRRSNPLVEVYNHVPPHVSDIVDWLTKTFRCLYSSETVDNVILKAMYIHNRIIEIWPFDNYSGELAILAMNYYLLERGMMPIEFNLTKEQYKSLVSQCLKGRELEKMYKLIYDNLLKTMEETVEICKGYEA